ncbi:hypothetical protein LTR08_002980 [Meristemomyces frigidus]|nr:hypothetical protein LTR08_002980 [Meristemomyces frigidus]
MSQLKSYEVVEADQSNLESLSTIHARSFHPVNPFMERVIPDTAVMRQWWAQLFTVEIQDTACKVLTALDPDTGTVIGILTLRLLGPQDRGSGIWTMCDVTDDHDREAYRLMIGGMTEHRERIMLGKPHFLVELLGVDHAYKGRNIGHKLLARACEIADEAGYETFVQANASARDFYCRLGFEEKGMNIVKGKPDYLEYMLVRHRKP